jgi:predicted N-formylglutamate amidohydrolase
LSDNPVQIIGNRYRPGPIVITCEHASNRVPPPLVASREDQPWLESHWGWDIGVATVTRDLVRQLDAVGVLSTYSRLVCDPNRDVDDPTWIRESVEGHQLSFNQELTDAECRRRRLLYHKPYHHVVDQVLADALHHAGEVLMLSVHSFTPSFGDEVRKMEAGVLFDKFPVLAAELRDLIAEQGFVTELNQPYSGLMGLMSAAKRHGTVYGVIYLQLELRQDLIATDEDALAVAGKVGAAIRQLGISRPHHPEL